MLNNKWYCVETNESIIDHKAYVDEPIDFFWKTLLFIFLGYFAYFDS
jgi:hypothetical protein